MEKIEFYIDGQIMESCPPIFIDRKLSEIKQRFKDIGLYEVTSLISGSSGYILFGSPVIQKASYVVWKTYIGFKDITGKKLYLDDVVHIIDKEKEIYLMEEATLLKHFASNEYYVRYLKPNKYYQDIEIKPDDFKYLKKVMDVTEKFK